MNYFSTEEPITIGDIKLITVVNIQLYSNKKNADIWLSASKAPYAIIVCSSSGVVAMDTTASEVPVDHLLDILPELESVLDGGCR